MTRIRQEIGVPLRVQLHVVGGEETLLAIVLAKPPVVIREFLSFG